MGGVNQVKQGNFSQNRPGIEPHRKAHGRPAPVPRLGCARPPNPIVAGHAIEAQNEMEPPI